MEVKKYIEVSLRWYMLHATYKFHSFSLNVWMLYKGMLYCSLAMSFWFIFFSNLPSAFVSNENVWMFRVLVECCKENLGSIRLAKTIFSCKRFYFFINLLFFTFTNVRIFVRFCCFSKLLWVVGRKIITFTFLMQQILTKFKF